MSQNKYYRKQITHRAAVRALIKIAETTLKHGTCSLYNSYTEDNYDLAIDQMVETIIRYKNYHDKYFELRKVLKNLVD